MIIRAGRGPPIFQSPLAYINFIAITVKQMDKRRAEHAIHTIALTDSGRVYLTNHARLRDPDGGKRPLTKPEILAVLEYGRIIEGPVEDIKVAGGWKFTMARHYEGHYYRVAGVLVPEFRVLVITGFEDVSFHIPRTRGEVR